MSRVRKYANTFHLAGCPLHDRLKTESLRLAWESFA